MGFVEFPRLILVGHCLREAGAGGSNPLTPTIFRCKQAILVDHCLFEFFSVPKIQGYSLHPEGDPVLNADYDVI